MKGSAGLLAQRGAAEEALGAAPERGIDASASRQGSGRVDWYVPGGACGRGCSCWCIHRPAKVVAVGIGGVVAAAAGRVREARDDLQCTVRRSWVVPASAACLCGGTGNVRGHWQSSAESRRA